MRAEFDYRQRKYVCSISQTSVGRELRILNSEGKVLAVQQGKRTGMLGVSREVSEEVDVSKPFFYNLIKLALQALETETGKRRLAEQEQLIIDKNQIIYEKNGQIELLSQQLELLQVQLDQLSDAQQQQLKELQDSLQQKETAIAAREQHIETLQTQTVSRMDPIKVEAKLKSILGEKVWRNIEISSQNDLVSAFINYITTKQLGFLDDYSESGVRLGFVIETEVITPFFQELYQFLRQQSLCDSHGRAEIGGVKLRHKQEQTLGKLPRLIAPKWTTFCRRCLDHSEPPQVQYQLYRLWRQDDITSNDYRLIEQFLNQWSHPLSTWLQLGENSAALIDQVKELRNRASHPIPLYEWQFRLLWSLVVDDTHRQGILHQIYG